MTYKALDMTSNHVQLTLKKKKKKKKKRKKSATNNSNLMRIKQAILFSALPLSSCHYLCSSFECKTWTRGSLANELFVDYKTGMN